MCGIVGFVGAGDAVLLERMTATLVHRGPDDSGYFTDPSRAVFLGHRRLSILDPAGGHQPMWNETGSVCVLFNGEIYNHAELRVELAALGHVFRSDHSDTEVLVHGYEEWGSGLPGRLNGMFAFAVYDRECRRLFLARDRFGEKPLYWCQGRGFFGFASELAALAHHPLFDRTIDVRNLQKYFAYGYLPAPHGLQRGSHKLPGGCHLTYDVDAGTASVGRYWRFDLTPDPSLGSDHEDVLVEELRSLLAQAVRRRLISDVPLGIFLSGGLDSSTILSEAVQARPAAGIDTFTIGFAEKTFDESPFALAVARHFGTRHHERMLDENLAMELIPEVQAHLSEPLADASIVPAALLSRFTRERVTVALSGDGGDELFAGYDPFKALQYARIYHSVVPAPLHRALIRLVDLIPPSPDNLSLDFKIKRALLGLTYQPEMWNPVWMSPLDPEAMEEAFLAPVKAEDLYEDAVALWLRDDAGSTMDRALEFFTTFYLPESILAKSDRASMMASLEARAVFLDNDLVAFCQRLPHHFKFRGGRGKYLLRKALAGRLPDSVLNRPKKGFGIPLTRWLRSMPQPPAAAGVEGMRASAVERRWREHRAGRRDHRLFLWAWLALQGAVKLPSTAT
jgi:asparagine synthase (glutamine-hydrolysing)